MTIELNAPIPEFSALKATSETEVSSGTLTDLFSVHVFHFHHVESATKSLVRI